MKFPFVNASDVEKEPVSWLWPNRLSRGSVAIVEGHPGANKSTMLYALVARVSRGLAMPNCDGASPPAGAVIISDEDTPSTIRGTLEANGADLSRIKIYDKTLANPPLMIPAGIEMLEGMIARAKAKVVVIDPVPSFIEGNINVDQSVRAALRPLTALAERHGAVIIIVRHLRKTVGGSALHQGSGSIGLVGAARSVLLVGKAPGNDDQRVVAHVKSNLGPLAGSLSFQVVEESDGGLRVEWLGPVSYSADEIASSGSTDSSALNEAAYVLYSILGKGPVLANDAKKAVLLAGIADRTRRRAMTVLNVKSRRVGFGPGSKFYWELPPSNELIEILRARDLDELAESLFHGPPDQFHGPSDQPPEQPIDGNSESFSESPEEDEDDDRAEWWKNGEKNDNDDEDEEGSDNVHSGR